MEKVFSFKYDVLELAMRNKLIGMFWRNVFSEKARFNIYQKFSILASEYEKLNKILVDILENENAAIRSKKHDKALLFLNKNKIGVISPEFREIWLEKAGTGNKYFNFDGAFIPYWNRTEELRYVFLDTFLFHVILNDNYSSELVEKLEEYMPEGPYSYITDGFDVTVKPGDIVIDAGAWIGDFSAYAAAKGGISYAFEPTSRTFNMLKKTAELNAELGGGGGFTL